MVNNTHKTGALTGWNFLTRLRRDVAGNTLAMLAAGLFPLLALVGGGIDMGRNYLSQTRLQQACDAGALAARKRLGTQVVAGGTIPTDVAEIGNRFFNLNYRAGAFGTRDRSFQMTLMPDYAIKGNASVAVPTTIMQMFGYNQIDISVACEAQLNFANTDVMFVLDTTGSMSGSRIAGLREAVKGFHRTMNQAVTSDTTRVRYGFVPYSMTVNVSALLSHPDTPMPVEFFRDSAPYESREALFNTPVYVGTTVTTGTVDETYPSRISSANCNRYGANTFPSSSGSNPEISGSAPGKVTRKTYAFKSWTGSGTTRTCTRTVTTAETTYVTKFAFSNWRYKQVMLDTSAFKTRASVPVGTSVTMPSSTVVPASENFTYADQAGYYDMVAMAKQNGALLHNVGVTNTVWDGCIEERDTIASANWNPVPGGAFDLDLMSAPDSEATRWRPQWERLTYRRSNQQHMDSTSNLSNAIRACPSPMRLFSEVELTGNPTDVPVWLENYLAALVATGNTYHDIGMIWGGRLASPRGIFAENVNQDNKPTSRHLIFMSDGQMEPNIGGYNAYGIEALSNRIAPVNSDTNTVTARHIARFRAACEAVKAEGITVWVVAFGTTLTNDMKACSSDGRAFYASDTAALQQQFSYIASQVANLRLGQ